MFTATIYNNTGFDTLNIPDSEATLDASASSKKNVPTMDILQLVDNTKIVIRATEEEVMQADFLKLTKNGDTPKSAYYAIENYNMTSGDTVELNVAMEPVLTGGGIDNIDRIDGSVVRHHFGKPQSFDPDTENPTAEQLYDYLKETTMEEDPYLQPSFSTHIDKVNHWFRTPQNVQTEDGNYASKAIVLSTIPLDAAADFQYDVPGTNGMTAEVGFIGTGAPEVPFETEGCYDGRLYKASNAMPQGNQTAINAYCSYATIIPNNTQMHHFKEKLAQIAANNLLGIITHVYNVPVYWVGAEESSGSIQMRALGHTAFSTPFNSGSYPFYNLIKTAIKTGASSLQPWIGPLNEYILLSTSTGETRHYNIEEVIQSDGTITATGCVDTRPKGGVKFIIKKYDQNGLIGPGTDYDNYNQDIMDGGQWETIPIDSVGRVGYNLNQRIFNAQQQAEDQASEMKILSGIDPSKNSAWFGERFSKFLSGGFERKRYENATGGELNVYQTPGMGYYSAGDVMAGVRAGNERSIAIRTREITKASELAQFEASNVGQPVCVGAAPNGEIDIYCHSLIVYRRIPDARDMQKFINIQSRFGCRHTTLFKKEYFNNRKNFNYIEMSGANVYKMNSINGIPVSKRLREEISDALNTGIRIWHTSPKSIVTDSQTAWANPYKEVT